MKTGEVILFGTGKHSNPIRRKGNKQIKQCLESDVQKVRNHAYCQPNFCAFHGGTHFNCNGTRREGTEVPDKIVWENKIKPVPYEVKYGAR